MLHLALLFCWSLAALAAAQGSSQCTSGTIVCCGAVQSANAVPTDLLSDVANAAEAILGSALVGLSCTELTVIGQGTSCATKQVPVCCTDNNYNGTVCLGCTHINPILA